MSGKRAIRLKTAKDVRKCLSKLVNQVNRGETDLDKARTIGYLCKIILDGYKTIELEQRLEAIEKSLEEQNTSRRRAF